MEFSYDSEDPIFESDSNDSSSQGDVPIAKKILFKKWMGETISQAREREGQMTSKVWEVRFDSVEIDTKFLGCDCVEGCYCWEIN